MQKLTAWAEKHGLSMDLEVESAGFRSELRAITFWNRAQLPLPNEATASVEASPAPQNSPVAAEVLQADPSQSRTSENPQTAAPAQTPEAHGPGAAAPELDWTLHEDFDWHSVETADEGEDAAWVALSREADCALAGPLNGTATGAEAVAQAESPAQPEEVQQSAQRIPESETQSEPLVELDQASERINAGKRRRGIRAGTTAKLRKHHREVGRLGTASHDSQSQRAKGVVGVEN